MATLNVTIQQSSAGQWRYSGGLNGSAQWRSDLPGWQLTGDITGYCYIRQDGTAQIVGTASGGTYSGAVNLAAVAYGYGQVRVTGALDSNNTVDFFAQLYSHGKAMAINAPVTSSQVYLLRDTFPVDQAAPLTTPRTASPGPGTGVITDTQSGLSIVNGYFTAAGQATTPTWGNQKIVYFSDAGATQGFVRQAGRALAALFNVGDSANDFAIHWSTSATPSDPRTVGHGWAVEDYAIEVITPGINLTAHPGNGANAWPTRPMEYLAVSVLQASGAYLLLSTIANDSGNTLITPIPQFPQARLVWAGRASTATPLYPSLSFYDQSGHAHEMPDLRMVDITSDSKFTTQNGLANFRDTFTAANGTNLTAHTPDTGAGTWTVSAGTFQINNNALKKTNSGNSRCFIVHPSIVADGIFQWQITSPATVANMRFTLAFRVKDANNMMVLDSNTANGLILYKTVAGTSTSLYTMNVTYQANTTYTVTLIAKGNQYFYSITDGASLNLQTNGWYTDASSANINETGMGLWDNSANVADATTFDNFCYFPETVTLPAEVQAGITPHIFTAGSRLAYDSFTAANGTSLALHTPDQGGPWTVVLPATATINNNVLSLTTASGHAFAYLDIGTQDCEISVKITTPTFSGYGTALVGLIGRWSGPNDYWQARIFHDPSQTNHDEIEFRVYIGGVGTLKKVQLGAAFVSNTTYTLDLQFKGNVVHCFLGGYPRITWYNPAGGPTGTKFGVYAESTDNGCVFDDLTIKAVA